MPNKIVIFSTFFCPRQFYTCIDMNISWTLDIPSSSPLLLPFLPHWHFLFDKSPLYFHFFFVWVGLTELSWNCLLERECRLLTKGQLTSSYTTEENDTLFHSNHRLPPVVPQKGALWIPLIHNEMLVGPVWGIYEQISKLCWVPECTTGYVCLFVDLPPTLCLYVPSFPSSVMFPECQREWNRYPI